MHAKRNRCCCSDKKTWERKLLLISFLKQNIFAPAWRSMKSLRSFSKVFPRQTHSLLGGNIFLQYSKISSNMQRLFLPCTSSWHASPRQLLSIIRHRLHEKEIVLESCSIGLTGTLSVCHSYDLWSSETRISLWISVKITLNTENHVDPFNQALDTRSQKIHGDVPAIGSFWVIL